MIKTTPGAEGTEKERELSDGDTRLHKQSHPWRIKECVNWVFKPDLISDGRGKNLKSKI